MSVDDYNSTQDAVRLRLGIDKTTSRIVKEWDAFVEECEEGYCWDMSEYNHELIARDHLDRILEDPDLQEFEGHKELAQVVAHIDSRFKGILLSNVALHKERSWWRRGVLRRAGSDYVEFIGEAHGIEVELCDS